MYEIIIKLLEENGYKPFFNEKAEYPADFQESFKGNAFVFKDNDREKELYLLHNHKLSSYTDEKTYKFELDKYQIILDNLIEQIKGFNILYRNQILSYNVNLILLCNFSDNQNFQDLTNKFLATFERNRYVCRKIFINTSNKDKIEVLNVKNQTEEMYQELMLLPFIQINNKFEVGIETTLLDDLNQIVKNKEEFDYIYHDLGKEINAKKISSDENEIKKYCEKIESLFLVGEISNE